MQSLPDDLYYMPFGRPAVATVTFTGRPSSGNTVTINGVTYTYGTDWGSRFLSVQQIYSPVSSARDLAELINGSIESDRGSLAVSPNMSIFARVAGATLLLFAREPGVAGNAYTLSTNNSTAFVISGATFSGGTAGVNGGGGSGGGLATVTPHFVLLGASGSQVIPSAAKGWTATILSGTGTIGTLAVSVGFSDSDVNILAASITVTTDAASSAYVRWNT